jgi:CHAT domain
VKILFLSANPKDVVARLRIDEEIREISQKIRLGTHRDQVELVSEWAMRARDLQEVLLRHKPDIVHFSGHCSPSSGIMLEDEDGNRKVVPRKALADLFRILKHNVRVVILNACYGEEQARALAEVVDFTIGVNAAIEDEAAKVFAAHFYQSLAYGSSVREAFDLAVNELDLEGFVVENTPVLIVRDGADAAHSRIVNLSRRAAVNEPANVFGSHLWHVLVTCALYASLYVVALVLEVSYDFDQFGAPVLRMLPITFGWISATSIVALALDMRATARGRKFGLVICVLLFLVASIGLFVLLSPVLPTAAITQARFQTHTAQAAYIKDSGLFLMLALLFVILPLHAVTSLEKEIESSQTENVLRVLEGETPSATPDGMFYIKWRYLGFVFGIILLWNLIVRAYILDQLVPGPNMNLFMRIYYAYLFLFLALPAYCLAWYYRALNNIKGRCLESSAAP